MRTKTLILLFHPDLTRSKANMALARAAVALPGVEVVDRTAAWGSPFIHEFS